MVNYDISSIKNRNFNILVIDNNENLSNELKIYLELRGHNVCIMDDGIQSLYSISKKDYDIIFVEHFIEDSLMCGDDLIECIKAIKDVLVIMYTGDKNNLKIGRNMKNKGANGVLYKPIDTNILGKFMNIIEKHTRFGKFEKQNVYKLSEKQTLNRLKKSITLF